MRGAAEFRFQSGRADICGSPKFLLSRVSGQHAITRRRASSPLPCALSAAWQEAMDGEADILLRVERAC